MLFKLTFKTLEQGKSVGCAARKSREHFVVVEPAHLPGAGLRYDGTQSYLAIAAKSDLSAASRRKYGSTVIFWHGLARDE